ncbi:SDR family NAD(P)-dependent oxidoreductase [Lysobacter korlensis]|uniref:SDR family NAD(P)-dependent oxidoreductase n=1 Tax=Lysobacter korlensis TaxID=553636 RepID=A0ABV6RP89_9GAMM
MADRLNGKTALVTGAGAGIGRTVALRFAREGARVVFADVDGVAAEAAADQAGERGRAATMDISDEGSVESAFAALADDGWTPDVVVANAGVQLFGKDARIGDLELQHWRRTIDVNLTGTFLTMKHAVRAMVPNGGGSILVTGSPTGIRGGQASGFTAYSTSKAGIHGMAGTAAIAYAAEGVRVNTVVPTYTETGLVSPFSSDPEIRANIIRGIPLGRPGAPEDLEGIMVFLASDESAFATGGIFAVDGGMTAL